MREHSLIKSYPMDNRTFKKRYNKVINNLNKLPLSNLNGLVIKKEFISAGFNFNNDYVISIGNLQINITYLLNVLSFEKVVYDVNYQYLYSTPKLGINERLVSFLVNKPAPGLQIVSSVLQHQEMVANKTGLFRTLTTTSQIKTIN